MKRFLAVLLALLTMTASASAETIRTYSVSWTEEAQALLADKYPDLQVERWEWDEATYYTTTAEFAAPLQLRHFDWDVFGISKSYVDAQRLMEKGYLLDLTDNARVRDYVSRMHPSVAAECMRDGKIYALPVVYKQPTGMMYVDMDNWLAAGYGPEDIPSTFSGYLDFLEGYAARREQDPDFEYVVISFDNDKYSVGSWRAYLSDLLVSRSSDQCNYMNESLRFNDPAVIALMERIAALSERLYRAQPYGETESYHPPCLFGEFPGWSHLEETRVDLRLSEDQPRFIPMSVSFTVVNAATDRPELAEAFALAEFEAELNLFPEYGAVLFQDAEPVPNPSFEGNYSHALNQITLREHRLAGDDTPLSDYIIPRMVSTSKTTDNRSEFDYAPIEAKLRGMEDWEVQEELAYWREQLERIAENQWLFPTEDIAAYQNSADELYFVEQSIIDTTQETRESYEILWRQFRDGRLTAREFCEQLDRVAWMMQLENP